MGLLDEAIREHLELKRRRGADPAEVAREQHEALDQASGHQPATEPDTDAEHPEEVVAEREGARPDAVGQGAALDDHPAIEPEGSPPDGARQQALSVNADDAGSLEETAELDMKSVLEDEELPAPEHRSSSEEGLRMQDAN
jgi:hypothetical protein